MLSFNGEQKIKDEWVAKGHYHAKMDMIEFGTYGKGYGDNFKGCTIGCYAERGAADKHQNVANFVDGSKRLNLCRDAIFEGLSRFNKSLGIAFHTQWIEAIPIGVDTASFERVVDKLILKSAEWKAEQCGEPNNRFLLDAAALYRRRIGGDEPSELEWERSVRDVIDVRAARAARNISSVLVIRDARQAHNMRSALYTSDVLDALAALDVLDARNSCGVRTVLDVRDAPEGFYISMRDEYLKLMFEMENKF